jgi:hypothetical protein
MGNKPEGANAGGGVALLALPVCLFALKLDLGLKANAPGLPRSTAQHVSPPVQTVWCASGLLREGIPTGRPGSDQALRFEVKVEIAFLRTFRSVPGRTSKEPGAKARDFGDGSPSAPGHPGIAIFGRSELLPLVIAQQRGNERFT